MNNTDGGEAGDGRDGHKAIIKQLESFAEFSNYR